MKISARRALLSLCYSRADRRIPYQVTLTGEANFAIPMPIARSGPYIRSSLVRDNCIWWLLWRLPLHSQIPKHNVWSLRISPRKHDEFQNCSKHHNQRTNETLVTSVTAIKVTTSTQILLASGYSWVYAAPRGKDNIESDNESKKKYDL